MEGRLVVKASKYDISEIQKLIQSEFEENKEIDVRPPAKMSLRFRNTEVTIALISLASTALGALITGIWKVIRSKGGHQIVIKAKNGRQITFSEDTDPSKIDQYILGARSKKFLVELPV